MTPDALFSIANLLALASWALLVFVPGQRWVTYLVTSLIVPGLFAVAYVGLIAWRFPGASGGFGSLPDVAALFRSVAEGETGHAFGHFDFLAEVGDPVTGVKVGSTSDNLQSAIAGETYEYTEMYPGFARTAREEGFEEVAEWLETLARAEKSHAGRFQQGLEGLS